MMRTIKIKVDARKSTCDCCDWLAIDSLGANSRRCTLFFKFLSAHRNGISTLRCMECMESEVGNKK